jgi:hypothetical protein
LRSSPFNKVPVTLQQFIAAVLVGWFGASTSAAEGPFINRWLISGLLENRPPEAVIEQARLDELHMVPQQDTPADKRSSIRAVSCCRPRQPLAGCSRQTFHSSTVRPRTSVWTKHSMVTYSANMRGGPGQNWTMVTLRSTNQPETGHARLTALAGG